MKIKTKTTTLSFPVSDTRAVAVTPYLSVWSLDKNMIKGLALSLESGNQVSR